MHAPWHARGALLFRTHPASPELHLQAGIGIYPRLAYILPRQIRLPCGVRR